MVAVIITCLWLALEKADFVFYGAILGRLGLKPLTFNVGVKLTHSSLKLEISSLVMSKV
jgi:hypothetical protein